MKPLCFTRCQHMMFSSDQADPTINNIVFLPQGGLRVENYDNFVVDSRDQTPFLEQDQEEIRAG